MRTLHIKTSLLTLALMSTVALSVPAEAGRWIPAGKLVVGVEKNNAFALADGRVVSVGIPIFSSWWQPATQVWSPSTNKWTKMPSAAPLPNIVQPVPVQLDDGRILVTGYCNSSCGSGSNMETYDPSNDSWALHGQMATGRYLHTATKLSDGRVLVAGGCAASGCGADTSTAEIFDPKTNGFTPAASMKIHRASFTATLLDNGRVLVAGGYNSTGTLTENETYDPVSNSWTINHAMKNAHAVHVAALLQDGRVLVAGGDTGTGLPGAESDLYSPGTGTWKSMGPLAESREYFAGLTLKTGKVLVAGGMSVKNDMFVDLSSAELFRSKGKAFVTAPSMKNTRVEFSMTMLPDGRVMAVGGDAYLDGEVPVPGNAEIYQP